jgi:hypothetical protein
MSEDELLLKNYQGQVFRYRNPVSGVPEVNIKTPVSGVVHGLLAETKPLGKMGELDADRVIVRP